MRRITTATECTLFPQRLCRRAKAYASPRTIDRKIHRQCWIAHSNARLLTLASAGSGPTGTGKPLHNANVYSSANHRTTLHPAEHAIAGFRFEVALRIV
jgi:hypothetical protein